MLFRTTIVKTLSSVENDVNLFTKAGSPGHALNAIFFNTAAKGASSTGTPAMRSGTSWKGGSFIYLQNSSTITGATGSTGGTGSGGSQGPWGAGGAGGGGAGVDAYYTAYGGSGGSGGGTGNPGGTGSAGGTGGPSLTLDTITGLKIAINNAGTISGGPGGPGVPVDLVDPVVTAAVVVVVAAAGVVAHNVY